MAESGLGEERAWLMHTVLGELAIDAAWERRGAGWASETSEEQWAGFRRYIGIAERHFRAAWSIRQDRPEPATGMITAVRGGQAGERWLERAAGADRTDIRPWRRIGWFARPRWGGSHATMWGYAERAFAMGDPASPLTERVPVVFMQILEDGGGGWLEREPARVWRLVSAWVERAERHLDEAAGHDARRLAWAMAMRVGRHEQAAELFERLGRPAPLSQPFRGMPRYEVDQRWSVGQMMAVRRPEARRALRQAAHLEGRGELGEAIGWLDQAIEALGAVTPQAPGVPEALGLSDGELAVMHLRDRRRQLVWRESLERGEEVDLLQHGFEGWHVTRGRWAEHPEGGVVGWYTQGASGLRLLLPFAPPPRCEIELTVRLPEEWRTSFGWKGVGLLLDAAPTLSTDETRFVFLRERPLLWFNDNRREGDDDRYFEVPKTPLRQTLRVWLDGDRATVALGDGEPVASYSFLGEVNAEGRLAIGVLRRFDREVGPVRFERLRLRRLGEDEATPVVPQ